MDFADSETGRRLDAPVTGDDIAVMARHGIVRVPADQYHVDGYRYSNLADALAQARRGSARGKSS